MTALTTLRSAYDADRAARLATAASNPLPRVCRYCGRHRWELPGTRLDGHALCVVSAEFMAQLAATLKADATISYKAAAEALGVDVVNVRAWYQRAARDAMRAEAARERKARWYSRAPRSL